MPYSFSLAWSLLAVECEGCKKFLLPSFLLLARGHHRISPRAKAVEEERDAQKFLSDSKGTEGPLTNDVRKIFGFSTLFPLVSHTHATYQFSCLRLGHPPPPSVPFSADVICECSQSAHAHALLPSSSSDGTVKGAIKRAQNRTELKHRPPVQRPSSVFP